MLANTQKSMVKNSIYNVIYTVVNLLFPLITSVYVARILLPAGVGKVAYAQNIASYFVTLASLGLPSYGVREFAKVQECSEEKNRLFIELILLNAISTTVAVIAYWKLVIDHVEAADVRLYIASGVVILFNYINIEWFYRGVEEYKYITNRNLAVKILSTLALVLLVNTRQDFILYAWISSLGSGVNYLFNILYVRKFISIRFSGIRLKRHIKPLLAITLTVFLGTIYSKIDITMLGMLATEESIGFYSNSQKIITIVIALSNAITGAFLPRLSYYYDNNREAFYQVVDYAFRILCVITLPLATGLFLVAEQVVVIMYGNSFIPVVKTIRVLCPLILIKGFGDLFCYQMAYSTKNEEIIIPASGCSAATNIAVNAMLIPVWKQNGAAIASVLSEFITNAIQFVYMKKKIGIYFKLRDLWISIVSTLMMIIIVSGIMELQISTLPALFLEILFGAVIYIISNLLLKNTLLVEVFQIVRLKFNK